MIDGLTIRSVFDRIYLVTCKSQYDTAMHFLRYQEFYECSEPQFRGNQFTILDYMRWYSNDREGADGTFCYTTDWVGFNLPCSVFQKIFYESKIIDENCYDLAMKEMYESIKAKEGDRPFYIIGCIENGTAIEHELAHGLWHVSQQYREQMQANIAWFDSKYAKHAKSMRELLRSKGYCEDVIDDELHAYMSTGLADDQLKLIKLSIRKTVLPRFEKTFASFRKLAKLPWFVTRKD